MLTVRKLLFQQCARYKVYAISLLLLSCYWAFHVAASRYIVKLVIDTLTAHQISDALFYIYCYIAISILFAIEERCVEILDIIYAPKIYSQIIKDMYSRIVMHSYSFFQEKRAGDMGNKIKETSSGTVDMLSIILGRFTRISMALFVSSVILFSVDRLVGSAVIIFAVFIIIGGVIVTGKARVFSHITAVSTSSVIGRIIDCFTNILNIKMFNAIKVEKKRLESEVETVVSNDRNTRKYLFKVNLFYSITNISIVSFCILCTFSGYRDGTTSIGDLVFVFALVPRIMEMIWFLSQEISRFSYIYGNVSQGVDLLNIPYSVVDKPDAKPLSIKTASVEFKDIYFKYTEDSKNYVLSDLSFSLPKGQKLGLVGYSGAGKTTLINILMRLFDVVSGEILINKKDIANLTQESVSKHISYIPQEPILFHRSIMENIAYGDPHATEERIKEAARLANAEEFINKLPDGYNTKVGERGIKLSGGQKQRIAIARIILKDAPLVILDEPTSALDSITETYLNKTLYEVLKGKTMIVIAHRLSTLRNMDKIMVLDKGKIVQSGSHNQLIKQSGLYKLFWNSQTFGFIDESNIDGSNIDKT